MKKKSNEIRYVDPRSLKIFPGVEIVPRPTPAEYAELRMDIMKHGEKDALDVIDDQVVDGLTRLEIALAEGLPKVPVRQITLGEGETPVIWAIKKAKLRRRLTDERAAMLGAELSEQNPEPRGGKRQGPKHAPRRGIAARNPAAARSAKVVGVPVSKVLKAKRLRKRNPALAEKVKAGELTLGQAKRVADEEKAQEGDALGSGDISNVGTSDQTTPSLFVDNKLLAPHLPRLYRVLDRVPEAIEAGTIPWPLPTDFEWIQSGKIPDRIGIIRRAAADKYPETFGAHALFRPPPKASGNPQVGRPAPVPFAGAAPAPIQPQVATSPLASPSPVSVPEGFLDAARTPGPAQPQAPAPARVPAASPIPAPIPFVWTPTPAQQSSSAGGPLPSAPAPAPVAVPAPIQPNTSGTTK